MRKRDFFKGILLFILVLTLAQGFAACGSQQTNGEKPSSAETRNDEYASVDNSTFARDAVYYTVSYDDGIDQFDFVLGTIVDENSGSFLSDVEMEVLRYSKDFDVELESDYMRNVAVEKITDKKRLDELKNME